MATTEHILKLKAVLDSKQVKQELQRLRQMQNQVSAGQSPVNQTSVRTNVSNINQSAGRLDLQMSALTKQVSALTAAITRLNTLNTTQSAKSNSPGAAIVPRGQLGNRIQQMFADAQSRSYADLFQRYGKNLNYNSYKKLMTSPIPSDANPFYATRMHNFRNLIGTSTSYDEFQRVIKSREFQGLLTGKPSFDKNTMKFVGGMALQQGVGSIAEYMQTSENNNVAAAGGALQSASKVGGYALMGASVGGPWGALAGAGLGAIESLFDTFTARAREAKEELDREWRIEQSLKTGTTEFIKGRKDYQKNKLYEDAFESLSEEYNTEPLSKQVESLTQRRDFVRSRLDVFENMSSRGFLGEQDLKSAKEMQQELVELDNKIKTSTNALKNYRQAFDNLKEADTYQESTRKLFKTGSLADIQSAYEKIKTRRDEAIQSGNLRDIQKYNPRMRSYEQQIERIREVQSQSSLELQRMDESYENTRVLERYGIGGGRGLQNTLMGYARKAAGERSRYEQLMKEGKLEEAAKAKESWQSAARERNSLADQLLNVLGNRTADLTNVTSLAQMGFGMGEKNDNYDRQMKVWEDQRNLQREIKNILNEKTFVATYGE